MFEVLVYTVIGIGSIIGFFVEFKWLYLCCAILLCCVLAFNIVHKLVRKNVYPFLISCLVVAFELRGRLDDAFLLGISFYYAVGWLYALILLVIPEVVLLLLVAITGLVFFILGNPVVAIPLGMFCFTAIIIAIFSGKFPSTSYGIVLTSMIISILLKSVLGFEGGIVPFLLWFLACTGCLFFLITAIYALLFWAIKGRFPNSNHLSNND